MEMPSPLAHLETYRDNLRPGAVEELAALWGAECSGLLPEAISAVIEARLALPKNAGYLKAKPPGVDPGIS